MKNLNLIIAGLLCLSGMAAAAEPVEKLLESLASSNAAERKETLNQLVETGDQRLIDILGDYRLGSLYLWNDRLVLGLEVTENDDLDEFVHLADLFSRVPLTDASGSAIIVPLEETEVVEPSRRERKNVLNAIMLLELHAPDHAQRLEAVRRSGLGNDIEGLRETLFKRSESDPKRNIRKSANESLALLQLRFGSEDEKRAAVKELGRIRSVRARSFLESLDDPEAERAVKTALARITTRERLISTFNILNSGISTGSVLVLMALGLAVTFGMMGVINMAHGEMMMIGAYTTYCMQLLFGHTPDSPNSIYYVVALPAAFLMSAAFGGLIEWTVVRRLYKRPLESLLATYGVGLLLIQTIRLIFGDNRPSNSPVWLQGGIELSEGMSLSFNRIFIFFLCAVCVGGVVALMRCTSLGLKMRAVIQNRDMAASMGINTRMTDSFTFMLGSGLAGIAGYALTTIGGITPDMGQNYIVDSFLVVVTGGVGNLAGVVCSGMGLGLLNKLLEGTFFGAVWAKIIVLVVVITFIQFKPSGLFAPKGRLADD
ncbi:urea ABC transporter permease subunit UrtB [Pontiella sp.]|uniref:urea ABC transporter permease subunit UrtB n=1 Tax=Pontiella sp. TaxID=2837462 RepID=UPI003568CD2A